MHDVSLSLEDLVSNPRLGNTMSPAEYREALAELGLTHAVAARLLGTDEATARGWACGTAEIPSPVARWLRFQVANRAAQNWKKPIAFMVRDREVILDNSVSINANGAAHGFLLVRARRPRDIENVFGAVEVTRTTEQGYCAEVPSRMVGEALQDRVPHDSYLEVWRAMSELRGR